jgi:hypothetical protein
MSKHSTNVVGGRSSGARRRRAGKPARPWVAAAAAIGGAGLVLSAPGAALMAAPAAQAAPVVPVPLQFEIPGLDFFGSGGLSSGAVGSVV